MVCIKAQKEDTAPNRIGQQKHTAFAKETYWNAQLIHHQQDGELLFSIYFTKCIKSLA